MSSPSCCSYVPTPKCKRDRRCALDISGREVIFGTVNTYRSPDALVSHRVPRCILRSSGSKFAEGVGDRSVGGFDEDSILLVKVFLLACIFHIKPFQIVKTERS